MIAFYIISGLLVYLLGALTSIYIMTRYKIIREFDRGPMAILWPISVPLFIILIGPLTLFFKIQELAETHHEKDELEKKKPKATRANEDLGKMLK